MNRPSIHFRTKEIETNLIEREILVHSAMHYRCDSCGKVFRFWIEKGLEDRKQDILNAENHKPVPFCIGCLCGGTAQHFMWHNDIYLDDYRPLEENENYFENLENEDCGISHFRNDGVEAMQRPKLPNLKMLSEVFGIETGRDFVESEEDDPYGLAHISTTKLKAELRRRKRR